LSTPIGELSFSIYLCRSYSFDFYYLFEVTKPKIPEAIRRNYESMEQEKTQ
jgi:hypothetical protein